MIRLSDRACRSLVAFASLSVGVYDLAFTMLPANLRHATEFEDVVPRLAIQGGHFGVVILAVLFIVNSSGLLHGKRTAWLITLSAAVTSLALHLAKNVEVPGTLLSLMLIASLLRTASKFPARLDRPTILRGIFVLFAGAGVTFVYSVTGLYLLDKRLFAEGTTLLFSLAQSTKLVFVVSPLDAEPISHHAVMFIETIRLMFLTTWVLGLWQLLQPALYRRRVLAAEHARVRRILEDHGDSALAFFALLPDKSYFFADRGDAFLAYRTSVGVAVVMGDPIGNESAFKGLINAFEEHCALNGWSIGFTQAHPRHLELYSAHSFKALKMGEEATIDVQGFRLDGTPMKHLRACLNKFTKAGYYTRIERPPYAADFVAHLRAISDEWLAGGRRRERTFTLGYFDRALIDQCPLIVVYDRDEHPVAFANIVPTYQSKDATFDMLRYAAEPKGLADFLCIEMIRHFKADGYSGLNLGLAPFSGLEDTRTSLAHNSLRFLYNNGEFLFRYRGLRSFKEKFRPNWESRYLIYRSEADLPRLALALMRLGEMEQMKPAQQPAPREASPVGEAVTA